jgi:hypothetical protein
MGRPLWREDGSVFYNVQYTLYFTVSDLRPGPCIYIPQELGGLVIPRGTGHRPPENPCLSLSLTLQPTVSRPVCLGLKHPSGAYDQILFLSDSCGFVDVGRCLWREDGPVAYKCSWSSPAQSFSGPTPLGFVTIFYCLRFETFPFRRLLRLAGLRWRYSTPPPRGTKTCVRNTKLYKRLRPGWVSES